MTRKRILLFFLTAVLTVLPVISGTGTADSDACIHNWVQFGEPATCTENGWSEWQCTKCYASRDYKVIQALGHNWGAWKTRKAATCTEKGTQYHQCTRCGTGETAEIAPLGHKWNSGKVTKAATCLSEGVKTYTCSRCGNKRTESIPMTEHKETAVPGTDATCTEPGLTEGSKCSVCGTVLKEQETLEALGHDWDEGTVTLEPQGFTPGERTVTCHRCGEKETEPVDPTASLFNDISSINDGGIYLRNYPVNPLHIIEQPEGGVMKHGGTFYLEVEVRGGEEDYTYEWWHEPLSRPVNPSLIELIASQAAGLTDTVQKVQNKTKPAFQGSIIGWLEKTGVPSYSMELSTESAYTLEGDSSNLFAEKEELSYIPMYTVKEAGRYWCVIYDTSGFKVTTDKVEVREKLYISAQPEDKNLFGLPSVTLSCRAGGGSGSYTYIWIDNHDVPQGSGSSIQIYDIGDYMCLVTDNVTGEQISSYACQVISDEATQVDLRPVITLQPENVRLAYREDGQYSWDMACIAITYDGGSQDLKYEWYGRSESGLSPVAEGEVIHKSFKNGIFFCKVTDTRTGQYTYSEDAYVNVEIVFEDMKIYYDLSVTNNYDGRCFLNGKIKGGAAPYTITVYEHKPYAKDGKVAYHDYVMGWVGPIRSDAGELKDVFLCWGNKVYLYWSFPTGGYTTYVARQFYIVVEDRLGQKVQSDYIFAPVQGLEP